MTYAAVDYELFNDTRPARTRYSLRERFGGLPRRKAVFDEIAANSASSLDKEIEQALDSDEPLQGTVPVPARASEHLADPEAPTEPTEDVGAATASEMTSELTTTGVLTRALTHSLRALLESARDERFEDGMDNNLSVGLRVLFRDYSVDFAQVLEERLKKHDISARILSEVFYTLGQIRHDATKDWRLAKLVDFLKSPSPSVRDAAAVGLAYLDDKRAAPYLREAIERETSESFREDLQAVVEQLSA